MNSAISFLSVLHNEKITSMKLFHSRGLVLLRFSISVSTADAKVQVICPLISNCNPHKRHLPSFPDSQLV